MALTKVDLFMVIAVPSVGISGVRCVVKIINERVAMPKKAIAVPLVGLLMVKRVMWLRFGLHLIIKV
jgi:hypothetical protein